MARAANPVVLGKTDRNPMCNPAWRRSAVLALSDSRALSCETGLAQVDIERGRLSEMHTSGKRTFLYMAKFILIDDSNFILKTTADFLKSAGHEVVACGTDGEEGFSLYKKHNPDLVLLDLTMPNSDGRECLRNILEHDANAKVLVVSAIREASIVNECMESGAKGYVEKPMKFRKPDFCQKFLETIDSALAA